MRHPVPMQGQSEDLEAKLAFDVHAYGLPEPRREYRFHETRRWRFDFAWPAQMIAVEVEGGTKKRGRHTQPDGFEKDCEKYNEATLLGWGVLRVTGDMVRDGRAVLLIERGLA